MRIIEKEQVNANPLAVLRILETAQDDIAIPADCLPVLTGPARLRPNGRGALADYFIFPKVAHGVPPCCSRAESPAETVGAGLVPARAATGTAPTDALHGGDAVRHLGERIRAESPESPSIGRSHICTAHKKFKPCKGEITSRLLALLLLLFLAPLLLLLSLLILIFDGRPVLFRQERYGQDGKPFRIVKFRTMLRRAPELHAELQAQKGQSDRPFKLADDPRVTRTGRFFRRWFLDELPQLWNIARGDMRFVGPRPLPASDQAHYTHPCHRLRLDGKPGLTGLWQVSGRNARTFDEMCLLDTYYLRNRTPALDLHILWRTLRVPFER